MHKAKNVLKGIAKNFAVSFFFVAFFAFLFFLFGEKQIKPYFSLAINLSYSTIKKENTDISFDSVQKRLLDYPNYGTIWATLKIPTLNLELPVYHGDTLDLLRYGVGHLAGSYFPGEGGSIVYMGHNSRKVFRRFSELQIGDSIKVTTSYGEFNYKIYDMQLINETETDKLPIQKEKEILMVYTCYPFNNIGYATQRYVVYAELAE